MPSRTTLKERSFSVRSVASAAAADFFTSATPRLMPEDQVLAHLAEREAGADEHAADGDRPDDEAVEVAGERRPSPGRPSASRVLVDQLGPEEEDEERDEEAPGEQAAGEVQGAELGPDDVADAEVGRASRPGAEIVVTPPAAIVVDVLRRGRAGRSSP